jgi:hypothetical protein
MSEELGKIEKPAVDSFKATRKLFFVPLLFSTKDLPLEIAVKIDHYWDEVSVQISNLESKLGPINRIYHELVPVGGAEALKLLNELNTGSLSVVKSRLEQGAIFEATEDGEVLAELMDWSRCLSLNLQSQSAVSKIIQFYNEANQKRNTDLSKRLSDTLKDNENGVLMMSEGHQVQFPPDIQLFYVAPPSLDEIKRWLRDNEKKAPEEPEGSPGTDENPLKP